MKGDLNKDLKKEEQALKMWSRKGEGRMFQVEDPEAGKHRMSLTITSRPAGLRRMSRRMDKVKEVMGVRMEADPYGPSEPV